jgi:hypothetical protein
MAHPRVLLNIKEIADYIERTSTEGADRAVVEEVFSDCHAELKEISVKDLISCLDLSMIDPAKLEAAGLIMTHDLDPIVIEGNVIWDGQVRLIAADKHGLATISAYCIRSDQLN